MGTKTQSYKRRSAGGCDNLFPNEICRPLQELLRMPSDLPFRPSDLPSPDEIYLEVSGKPFNPDKCFAYTTCLPVRKKADLSSYCQKQSG